MTSINEERTVTNAYQRVTFQYKFSELSRSNEWYTGNLKGRIFTTSIIPLFVANPSGPRRKLRTLQSPNWMLLIITILNAAAAAGSEK